MLPAHEEILSIQLVTNNKYARQVRSCAAGLRVKTYILHCSMFKALDYFSNYYIALDFVALFKYSWNVEFTRF